MWVGACGRCVVNVPVPSPPPPSLSITPPRTPPTNTPVWKTTTNNNSHPRAITTTLINQINQSIHQLHNCQKLQAEKYAAVSGAPPSLYCKPSSLGLIYDLTPAEFVTALVTEVGIIPPTSVPVIIRETKDRQSSGP